MSVCAIVLTFNRKGLLEKALHCLLNQTRVPDTILVVDNNSSDGTVAYLRSMQASHDCIEIRTLDENLGPAGGFAEGMRWAVEKGFSHLWIMDDDVFPQRECLTLLLRRTKPNSIAFPGSTDPSGSPVGKWGWSGCLIESRVVEEVGYPDARLFYWIEDTEYLMHRLVDMHGVTRVDVEEAKVIHLSHRPGLLPSWQYYYKVRNTIYYRLFIQRGRYSKLVNSLAKLAGKIVLKESDKWVKLRYYIRGIKDGISGTLGKTVDP